MKVLYTTDATATGGRAGSIVSSNGVLDLEVRMPKALGGSDDDYLNPEMLFAGGYAACFDSALGLVIRTEGLKTGITTVTANVSIGQTETGGFCLAATLHANIPGVSLEVAQQLIEKTHAICPYSVATKGNMDVKLTVSNKE